MVIIGAGACGCTTAYYLAQAGLSVALVDRSQVGQEASWASAGMIGPESCPLRDPWFTLATTLSRTLYDQLEAELYDRTGRRVGYGGQGHLVIARRQEELNELAACIQQQHGGGIAVQRLDASEARQHEPALPEDVMEAAWMPEGRFLDARQFTATIGAAASQLGVHVHEGRDVTGLIRQGGRIIGIATGHETLHAGTVINAAGAWAGRIDPNLSHPVFPLHGQIMSVAGLACGLRHNVSRAGVWGYVTPRSDGRVVVGATHEEWGYVKKVTPDGLAYLGQIVRRVLPALSGQPVLDVWSGLRPGTIDGLPTIGPDPRVDGGYLWAAGHSSAGMMQIPATAKVLVDLVMQRKPVLSIEQLSIQRYLDAGPVTVAEPLKRVTKRFMSA